jgi:hypothetical protein
MARFRIEHPKEPDLYAIGGHDHMLGFFCELYKEGRERPLKVLDVFKMGKAITLQDCFDFLVTEGFFTRDDLEETLVCFQDGKRVPKRLEKVVKIVQDFKYVGE